MSAAIAPLIANEQPGNSKPCRQQHAAREHNSILAMLIPGEV